MCYTGAHVSIMVNVSMFFQIEALKAIGVTEVVLAINYQPEVKKRSDDFLLLLFFIFKDSINWASEV